MQDFITHPATVYALIGYGVFVSIGCATLAYLWQLEKDEAEKAEGAAKFFEDKSAELIKIRDGHKALGQEYIDAIDELRNQLENSKTTSKALTKTLSEQCEILNKAYIRNAYGQLQRYDDWAINGDKKPKQRTK